MGTVPTPLDWIAADGTFITAAIGQAGVGDVLNFLLDPPAAQIRRTSIGNLVAATPSTYQFDVEDYDTDAMHSGSGTQLICKTAGVYRVWASIPFDAATNGSRDVRLKKNGSVLIIGGRSVDTTATSVTIAVGPVDVALIVNDVVEVEVISSTTCTTTATNGLFPVFRATWVKP